MRVIGKVVGAVAGFAIMRNPLGLIVGGLVGHAFDAGWLAFPSSKPDLPPVDEAYSTLGVAPDASDAQIDQAYRKLMGKFHPDRVAGAADEIRDLAEQRAQAINAAYDRIRKLRRPAP